MKKLFALMLGLLSCTLLLCLSVNAVELYVDTELVQTDVPPQLVGGRTLVPMRAILSIWARRSRGTMTLERRLVRWMTQS